MSFQLASSVRGCSVDLWVNILKECVLGAFSMMQIYAFGKFVPYTLEGWARSSSREERG